MISRTFEHTVPALLRRAYDNFANDAALIRGDGGEITFAELREIAARTAGGLYALGLQPGDRVVVALRNSAEFMTVDHALFWGGLVRVAVSFRLHPQEIALIAADASARVVVADAALAPAIRAGLAERGVDAVVVQSNDVGDQATVASLAAAEPVPAYLGSPEDLIWMPYTSGTTGQPKGVMHTHRSIMACLRNLMAELPPVDGDDTLLQVAPMSHLAGWVGLLYAIRGARQLFASDFKAADALAAIERHRVTITPVVPTIVNLMTDEMEQGSYDVSSLKTILYAGSPIAPEKLARAIRAFGDVFVQCYGLTELPMPISSLSMRDHRLGPGGTVPARLGSAGRVSPFVEVRIADQDGAEVPDGDAGEIWVRADMVMRGYWKRPADSAEFAQGDGWARTGDVGRLVDGYLHIVDRQRDMIVSGGFNVFPSEVENVISVLPGIREVAVIGVPDPRWGETVMAVVVREPGCDLIAADIQHACRSAIAGYKLPRRIEFVDELPKTSSGKLLRRELRSAYWEDRARMVDG